jgi:hypothetical protein
MQSNPQKRKTDKEKLFSKIREEKVTLFIGSGFSIRAGAPSAREIVKAIKDKCPQIEQTELKDVAREYTQRNNDDKEKLIEILRSIFPQHACCDDNQKALTRLPHFKQIFTTNYDSFLEDAYVEKCHVIRQEEDLKDCNGKTVQIYKLHGDFVNKNDIVITDDDYNDFFDFKKNSLIWSPLKLAMMNTHMVFIGYSLDDSNIFRIIQSIENLYGTFPREMYMITPSAEEYKANRLKKHNIKWIQSTAENFLAEIEQIIHETIFDDYRKRKISSETFIKFCHIHDINPSIKENDQSNEVVDLQGYRGKKLTRKVSIQTSYNPFENFNFEKSTPIAEGPFKGRYAITIPASEIYVFETRVNGIREFCIEDVASIRLIPEPKIVRVKIKIPGRNFIGTINCSILQMSPTSYSCTFDFDICIFTLTISRKNTYDIQLVNINVETKDIYISQDNALRWIEVIDAIFSGEKVLFPELNNLQIHVKEKQEHPFNWFKKYYEYVQVIELNSSASFVQYNNFTPERYDAAKKLYHWLTHEELCYPTPEGGQEITFEYTNELAPDEFLNASPEHNWGMAISRDITPILFNGVTFTIPYDYLYFDNCSIGHIEKRPNGYIKMRIRNNAPMYKEILTSSPTFQDLTNKNMITVTVQDTDC